MDYPVLVWVAGKIPEIKNIFYMQLLSGASAHLIVIPLNYLHNSASHGAVSQNRNFYHNPLPLNLPHSCRRLFFGQYFHMADALLFLQLQHHL